MKRCLILALLFVALSMLTSFAATDAKTKSPPGVTVNVETVKINTVAITSIYTERMSQEVNSTAYKLYTLSNKSFLPVEFQKTSNLQALIRKNKNDTSLRCYKNPDYGRCIKINPVALVLRC